ncbi:hypothetical protein GCM10011514_41900 [Emticicia aquatilis]|uniref:Uncharacterized protein n=1 Tax=Emticicia aquatilis TaxID=1537369 RepID=A0A917DV36_9BACT|nr:hypothetical protein [Emticicia aquatilis]GGD73466.1 hypothetical protein GCM10011514_41900 [Emticicia aquatilis]
MSVGEAQQLKVLKLRFIKKVIEDFGDDYLPIRKNDFESINLSALVSAILKKNKVQIPEHKLREFLVSEQTLRRIFEERDKETTFQQTTRNFLSLYIGYQNYQDFLEKADFSSKPKTETRNWRSFGIGVLLLGLFVVIGFVWKKKILSEPLKGNLSKVVFESTKAPITAKFSYDFSHLNFNRAILEYSLWGKKDTLELDKTKKTASVCFMHPTVRIVRLVADGKVLDSVKVVVPSDGWVSGYEEINYLPAEQWKKNGVAHIPKEAVPNAVREQSTYYSFIKKVANFDRNLSADEMIFETRLKNPVSEGGISCNDVSVVITGEKHKFLLNLTQKGCSHYAYVHLPNLIFEGKTHDLSKLGVNLDDFVRLKLIVNNRKLQIFIEDQLAFQTNYLDNFGSMQATYIGFKGLGSVDYIKISDNNKVLEEENF